MAYRNYKFTLIIRVVILFMLLTVLAFAVNIQIIKTNLHIAIIALTPIILLVFLSLRNLLKFMSRRFYEMEDFLESIKYKDFSRWFPEDSGPKDIRKLHSGFNQVTKTINDINSEKEMQHLYLKKILELIDTGIIAFNIKTDRVLWVNEAFKEKLKIPSSNTIHFAKKRNLNFYGDVFVKNHENGSSITINVNNDKMNVLISSSMFLIGDETFKLIVLQDIDDTISRTESEAWKKLLSVMTHEIMNSIAPITSLAETLHAKVLLSKKDPIKYPIALNDLDTGITSIQKRSEGLLKFARTYRSLNKITTLNLSTVFVKELFENIKLLMLPSLEDKNIEIDFEIDNPGHQIKIDLSLIEQVLINLIINSVQACKTIKKPKIRVSAQKNIEGNSIIKIEDNGIGIRDEIADRIFVPFFSTKKNGTGIGLSLCKQIMLLHKGKIQIKSAEEKGTIISLTL